MVKVSVLIPVYNAEQYLKSCMESVVCQTLDGIEIICINDGSTDSSGTILNQYANSYPNVKVIHKENTGYGHSLNTGLKVATGEYVGFVESDDFAERDMFEVLYENAVAYDVDFVKSNHFYTFDDHTDIFWDVLKGLIYNTVLSPVKEQNGYFHIATPPWNGLYKRSFLLGNDIWFNETPGASYQDVSFGIKVLISASSMVLIREAFLHYRADNPASSVHSKDKVFCICDEFEEAWRFLDNKTKFLGSFHYQLPAEQYKRYIWSYNRIGDEYKDMFLHRMIDEFKELNRKGYLKKKYWSNENDWLQAQDLVNCSEKALSRNLSDIQSRKMLYEALMHTFQNEKNIYVFGAGIIGREVVQILHHQNIHMTAILVSSKDNNPTEIYGLSVDVLNEIDIDINNSLILVAVGESTQYQIVQMLRDKGFEKILIMGAEIRKSLI